MKRQYLGDSKDSFKWDYHDYITKELNYPALVIALMMTPDDGGGHGSSEPDLFPARDEIIAFCEELRKSRSLDTIRTLRLRTGGSYVVALHRGDTFIDRTNRGWYFSGFDTEYDQVILLDPDNGFEPEKSYNEKHVRYSEITAILRQVPERSVVSVFQHFRRKPFVDDYARIKERVEEGYTTAIYWHSLMFVAVSKSEEAIARVVEANEKYATAYPVTVL